MIDQAMPWFKVWSEARNDAKLRALSGDEFRVWFNLLCYASEQPERGTIANIGSELLAVEVANGDVDLLHTTIARLEKFRILECHWDDAESQTISFIHYDERQNMRPAKPSDQPERVAERVRAYRERRKASTEPKAPPESHQSAPIQDNTSVTPCNAPVTRYGALHVTPEEEEEREGEVCVTNPAGAREAGVKSHTPPSLSASFVTQVERDPYYLALVDEFGPPGLPTERLPYIEAVNCFRAQGIPVEEVRVRAARLRRQWSHLTDAGPRCLMRNWSKLAEDHPPPHAPKPEKPPRDWVMITTPFLTRRA